MTILFRYLLREYLKMFTMCFAGLMTIYLVIDFFEKVRRFLRYDADWADVLAYFLLKTPGISYQIAPLAMLMATLLSLGVLSRNHEITAMRSCGISLYRLALPFLACAITIGAVLLMFSSTVTPLASALAEQIKVTQIEKRMVPVSLKAPQPWLRLNHRLLMNLDHLEMNGHRLGRVRLYQLTKDFRLERLTEAKEAIYSPEGWVLRAGRTRQFEHDGSVMVSEFGEQRLPLAQIPEDFTTWFSLDSDDMTFTDIRQYVTRLERSGMTSARLLTDYHGRIAFPFVAVIMAITGIALSLIRSGTRGGSMAVGIGQALVVGFCYWATHSIAIALGRSGVLIPILAGWMANLVFISFGSYLFLKVRY